MPLDGQVLAESFLRFVQQKYSFISGFICPMDNGQQNDIS